MADEKTPTGIASGLETGQKVSGAQPQLTVSDVFGQITWLMTQSKTHRNFFISDLEWMVMPPVLLKQFRLFPGKTQPLGCALWAKLSAEVEQRLEAGVARLAPQDWNSGDRLWLVELLAPFGHQEKMIEDLKTTIFAGQQFKMHSVTADGKRKVVTVGDGKHSDDAPATPPTIN